MARINVEQTALTDTRFRHLGELLRCPKRFAAHAARGIMEHVWNHMTERWSPEAGPRAYCVTSDEVRRLFDGASYAARLCPHMVSADLAEETEFGFRVKGTLGRIEWLNLRRNAARENGKAGGRKPSLVPNENQVRKPTSVNPPAPAPAPSPAPAPAPAPALRQEQEPERAPKSNPRPPVAENRDGFADHAFRTWQTKHGEKPPWRKPDYVALADASRTIGDDAKARAAWDRYLRETDAFYAGHSPRKFVSDLSRFVGRPPAAKLDGAYTDPKNATLRPDAELDAIADRRRALIAEERASGKHADEGSVLTAVVKRMSAERETAVR